MKGDKLNFEELIKFTEELLDKTGVIALNYFRETRNLSLKGDQSPVTHADHEIEKLISSSIQEKFPTNSIIGEEFEDLKNVYVLASASKELHQLALNKLMETT